MQGDACCSWGKGLNSGAGALHVAHYPALMLRAAQNPLHHTFTPYAAQASIQTSPGLHLAPPSIIMCQVLHITCSHGCSSSSLLSPLQLQKIISTMRERLEAKMGNQNNNAFKARSAARCACLDRLTHAYMHVFPTKQTVGLESLSQWLLPCLLAICKLEVGLAGPLIHACMGPCAAY